MVARISRTMAIRLSQTTSNVMGLRSLAGVLSGFMSRAFQAITHRT